MGKSMLVMSIIRAANILNSISHGDTKLRQIAATVNLTKGTTHRLLATLAKAGFVVKEPFTSEYFLGPTLLQLASNLSTTHASLLNCAMNEMEGLQKLSGETILLHIRNGLTRVCIARVESSHSIRYTNEIGFVAPLYVGGAGKILLSQLSDDELSLVLDSIPLLPLTSITITDRKALQGEIDKVKEKGYATSFGERVQGSSCISVSIRNYIVPVALSILGPITRFNIYERPDVLSAIQASSISISKKLGTIQMKLAL